MTVEFKTFPGLCLDPNPHGSAPAGSTELEQNTAGRRAGLVSPRPGLWRTPDYAHISAADALHEFAGDVLAPATAEAFWLEATSSEVLTEQGDPLTTFAGYWAAASLRKNLYVGSDTSIRKLTAPGDIVASPVNTGIIGYIERQFATSATAAQNWIPDDGRVGYRVVVRKQDANGLVVYGPPSSKLDVLNTAGADRYVVLTIYLPPEVIAGDFLDVYRTETVTSAASPEDMLLVGTAEVTGAQVTAGSVVFNDTTPDTERTSPLYTSPSEDGQNEHNYRPWVGKALAAHQQSLFVGNIQSPQFFEFTLGTYTTFGGASATGIGVRSASGTALIGNPTIAIADTTGLQVGMLVFQALSFPTLGRVISIVTNTSVTVDRNAAAGAVGAHLFIDSIMITDGTTTQYFVAATDNQLVGNVNSNSLLIASGPGSTDVGLGPSVLVAAKSYNDQFLQSTNRGRIRLESRYFNGDTISIAATHGNEYEPPIPLISSGSTQDFETTQEPALLIWSKWREPEHFRVGVDFAYVGDPAKAIIAEVNAGNRLYIAKEDGIYQAYGATQRSGFAVEPVAGSLKCLGSNFACEMDGRAVFWCDRGVIIVSEGGIEDITTNRIGELLRVYASILGPAITGNLRYDPINHELILCIGETRCLIYNSDHKHWSDWTVLPEEVVGQPGTAPKLSVAPPADYAGSGHALWTDLDDTWGGAFLWYPPPLSEIVLGTWQRYTDYGASTVTGNITVVVLGPTTGGTLFTLSGTWNARRKELAVGDAIYHPFSTGFAVVTEVASDNGTTFSCTAFATIDLNDPLAGCTVWHGYDVKLRFLPQADETPTAWKHWISVIPAFVGPMSLWQVVLTAISSKSDDEQAAKRALLFDHNGGSLAGSGRRGGTVRLDLNRKHATAHEIAPGFRVRQAGAYYHLAGFAATAKVASRRNRKQ